MSWKYRCDGVDHIHEASAAGRLTAAFQMALNARGRTFRLPSSRGAFQYDERALVFLSGAKGVTDTASLGPLIHAAGPVIAVVSPPGAGEEPDSTHAIAVIGITADDRIGYLDPADATGAVRYMDRYELAGRCTRLWVVQ